MGASTNTFKRRTFLKEGKTYPRAVLLPLGKGEGLFPWAEAQERESGLEKLKRKTAKKKETTRTFEGTLSTSRRKNPCPWESQRKSCLTQRLRSRRGKTSPLDQESCFNVCGGGRRGASEAGTKDRANARQRHRKKRKRKKW